MLAFPWGVEEGWGAGTSLPGIPLAFLGPCPPSSLPQPGHKLFQACKIWSVALLFTAPSEAGVWALARKPTVPPEPRGSGQLGQRKPGDLLGCQPLEGLGSSGAQPTPQGRDPEPHSPQPVPRGKMEKWLGQAIVYLGVQHGQRAFRQIISDKGSPPPPDSCLHHHFTEKTEPQTRALL